MGLEFTPQRIVLKKPAAGTRIKTHPQRPVVKNVAVAAGRRTKKPALVGYFRNGCAGISAFW